MVAETQVRRETAAGEPDPQAGVDTQASVSGQGRSAGERQLYLTCTMGGSTFLVSEDAIREVEEVGTVTPVPNTPSWLRGVMNLRGDIIGVIDLAHVLGLTHEGTTGSEALIYTAGELTIALAVDTVSAMRSLTSVEILPLPEQFEGGQGEAVGSLVGLYRAPEGLIGVLDLERLVRALELDQVQTTG